MEHTFEPTKSWTYIILNPVKFDECIAHGDRHTYEELFKTHKK